MGFKIVLSNVLVILIYLLCGFLLVKFKKAKSEHAKSLSSVLIYVCQPCMVINSIIQMEYSMNNLKNSIKFFFVTLIIQLLMCQLLYVILRKKLIESKYRVLIATTIAGNVGFMGMPIINALFPSYPIVSCYSIMFTVSMNLIIFTIGLCLITNDKKHISIKTILTNVTSISVYIAIPIYLMQIKIHPLLSNSINLLGKMTTPICMLILGMRLASMNIKETFTNRFAYIASVCKLILLPMFAYLLIGILIKDEVFKTSVIVLSSVPSAAIVLSLAELYECEQKLSANILLLSTILSVITMPLFMLILK